MPYLNIWIHFIWSTKNRQPLLTRNLRPTIFTHIRKNATKHGIHIDFINGYVEHVHVLISLKSNQTIAKIAQLLKGESSHWINQNNLTFTKFEWQDEYIAISVSESILKRVREYIKNQPEHHRKKSFTEEYQSFMKKYKFHHSNTRG